MPERGVSESMWSVPSSSFGVLRLQDIAWLAEFVQSKRIFKRGCGRREQRRFWSASVAVLAGNGLVSCHFSNPVECARFILEKCGRGHSGADDGSVSSHSSIFQPVAGVAGTPSALLCYAVAAASAFLSHRLSRRLPRIMLLQLPLQVMERPSSSFRAI